MNPMRPGRRNRLPLSLRRQPVSWERQRPTWRDAKPASIAEALKRAQARPSGNWYVVGASRALRDDRPLACTVAGREVIVWRAADGRLVAGPGICPHLGAPLKDSPVRCGTLVCHWHGLSLDGTPFGGSLSRNASSSRSTFFSESTLPMYTNRSDAPRRSFQPEGPGR